MKLTIRNKLKICWEVLTTSRENKEPAEESQLSTYSCGYKTGVEDCELHAKEQEFGYSDHEQITD